jgi:uncharacterized membrane protein
MPKRRRPARERLEVYLLNLLLAHREILLFLGLTLLVYGVVTFFLYPIVSGAALLLVVFIFLLVYSFRAALYTARLGAWIGTLWRQD